MKKSRLFGAVCAFTFSFISTVPHAALVSRLNGQAVYDTDLDITWTANGNLAASQTFGVSEIDSNGLMFGDAASLWVASMNQAQYLGIDTWRLTTSNCSDAGYVCTDESEFGHLFYGELGGSAFSPISGTSDTDYVLFAGIQDSFYWTGSTQSGKIRNFSFGDGAHSRTFGGLAKMYVWAVADGDVFVPIPAAAWLFGSGLLVLGGITRKKKVA